MTTHPHERIVVLGASDKPDRYSHRALVMLQKHGHHVIPVHPTLTQIEGIPVVSDLGSVSGHVDTITVYVGPTISSGLAKSFIQLQPRRVIFNPGAENPALASQLQNAGISTEDACTLVLLSTGTY